MWLDYYNFYLNPLLRNVFEHDVVDKPCLLHGLDGNMDYIRLPVNKQSKKATTTKQIALFSNPLPIQIQNRGQNGLWN